MEKPQKSKDISSFTEIEQKYEVYACGAADVKHTLFMCRGKHVYAS